MGQNYLKSLLALGFQAFLIMVVVGIYAEMCIRDRLKSSGRTYDVLALCELRRNGHKSVEINRHYSIQHLSLIHI